MFFLHIGNVLVTLKGPKWNNKNVTLKINCRISHVKVSF